jgi:hypothetical protein
MGKMVEKSISMLLVFVMSFIFMSSCDFIFLNDENVSAEENPQDDNQEDLYPPPGNTSGWFATKTLFSYDELSRALEIVGERYDLDPTYTVRDMGEGYEVLYYFWDPPTNIEYPIGFEEFFSKKSLGNFYTYIVITNKECNCDGGYVCRMTDSMMIHDDDVDYNKVMEYRKNYACVRVRNFFSGNAEKIEDKALLSFRQVNYPDNYIYHVIYYNREILELESCVMLDAEFFELFLDSLVVTIHD